MSINKYQPHAIIVPEDDANRQLAVGFLNCHDVIAKNVQIVPPLRGWQNVLNELENKFLPSLPSYTQRIVIALIDFDDNYERRFELFRDKIPPESKDQVMILGSKIEPETLQRDLNLKLEQIGDHLAAECASGTFSLWKSTQLQHNMTELSRMMEKIKPLIFAG